MTESRPERDQPVVVGVFYPPAWYGDRAGFADAVAALTAIDPRVEIVVETYAEPHELRSARGKPDADQHRDAAPPLSDAQRAAFERVHVALAIDLPFDVARRRPEPGVGPSRRRGHGSAPVRGPRRARHPPDDRGGRERGRDRRVRPRSPARGVEAIP